MGRYLMILSSLYSVVIIFLYEMQISTYINTKMCVCLSVCVFLGHLESDGDTLWHKVSFWSRKGSKTIIFKKKFFFRRVIALFLYFFKISL